MVYPVLGTENPVRGNSDGVLLFSGPHRIRNFPKRQQTVPRLFNSSSQKTLAPTYGIRQHPTMET